MSSGRRSCSQKQIQCKTLPLPLLPERDKHQRLRPNSRLHKKDLDQILEEEERIGEIEYTKVVIKALKEAIKENDELRSLADQINKENEQLKDNLTQRDNIILELAEYYKFCQDNHLITQGPIKRKNYNSFSSLAYNKRKRTKGNK